MQSCMEQCSIGDLRCREVINICTCDRMGYVSDVLLDLCCGQVKALVVPGQAKYFGLIGRGEDCIVPWNAIRSIGEDLILVELNETRQEGCCEKRTIPERKHWKF